MARTRSSYKLTNKTPIKKKPSLPIPIYLLDSESDTETDSESTMVRDTPSSETVSKSEPSCKRKIDIEIPASSKKSKQADSSSEKGKGKMVSESEDDSGGGRVAARGGMSWVEMRDQLLGNTSDVKFVLLASMLDKIMNNLTHIKREQKRLKEAYVAEQSILYSKIESLKAGGKTFNDSRC